MDTAKMIAATEEQIALLRLAESLGRATKATARWCQWPGRPEVAVEFGDAGGARTFLESLRRVGVVPRLEDALDAPPVAPAAPAFVPPAEAPAPPYVTSVVKVGAGEGVAREVKVFPHGGGPLLTPEEAELWRYIRWLEGEVVRLREAPAEGRAAAAA